MLSATSIQNICTIIYIEQAHVHAGAHARLPLVTRGGSEQPVWRVYGIWCRRTMDVRRCSSARVFNMYAVASAAVASAARITTATIQELYNTLVLVVARHPSLVSLSLYCIIGGGSFTCASHALTHTLYIRSTLARRRPAQFPLYAQRSSSSETSAAAA